MPYQSQSNILVSYKAQTALGTPASGAGARVLRSTGGSGGQLTKSTYGSNEIRADGTRARGRHGGRKTSGSYGMEWSLGVADDILEAIMRGTWDATPLTITEATSGLTSITTTASTIVAAAGSWITAGLKVGDVIRLANHTTAGNNGRNLRITALTASTITVAETLTANPTADTNFTITCPRKLINPATRLARYFTIEEYEADVDGSEVFSDCVWGSAKFTMQPNGLLLFEPAWTGTGQSTTPTGATAPQFTAPTEPTGVPLSVVDATIRVGSTDVVDLTALDLTLDIKPGVADTIGSVYSPDVFVGTMDVSLNFTALRKDLQFVTDFAAETVYSLHIVAVENESEPRDFLSIYVPNFTLGQVQKSATSREGGPRTQAISVPADLVGKDTRGGEYDATMLKFQVSN